MECGLASVDEARGWRAYLADVDDDGQDDVVLYCPACAAHEFGENFDATTEQPSEGG